MPSEQPPPRRSEGIADVDQYLYAWARPTRTAVPDVVTIDGHQFRIHYDVPREITDCLVELCGRMAEVR